MTKEQRLLVIFVLVVISGGLGMFTSHYFPWNPSAPPRPSSLNQSSDFSLLDTSGQMRHSNEWHGKVLLLNFWAPWCPPCRKEIPGFISLYKSYREQGLMIVGVALDEPEEVRHFVSNLHIDYPNLIGNDAGSDLADRFGNNSGSLPYTVIFDRGGKLVYRHLGELSVADAEAVIRPLLTQH